MSKPSPIGALLSQLPQCLIKDRFPIRRQLQKLGKADLTNESNQQQLAQFIERINANFHIAVSINLRPLHTGRIKYRGNVAIMVNGDNTAIAAGFNQHIVNHCIGRFIKAYTGIFHP